jgi:hypothetical protein
MEEPWSHLSFHNRVLALLPTSTVVEISNIAHTASSVLLGMAVQVRDGSVRTSHSQPRRKTYPIVVRSRTPSLPSAVGLVTLSHATVQRPPLADSVLVQMNDRRILSTACKIQGKTTTAIDMWMGMAQRVTLVRVVRPTLFMRLDFQESNRSATESTKGMRSFFFKA